MSGVPKNVQNARKGRYNRQTGLKLQGDANRVDLSRMARRAIKRRVHTNFKVKGYDSDYRCDHGIDPNTVSEEVKESYCYNANQPGTVLLEPAPFHQSAAGGVGHIYYPRRKCGSRCFADPKSEDLYCYGVTNIRHYLNKIYDSSGNENPTYYNLIVQWDNPPEWEKNKNLLPEIIKVYLTDTITKKQFAQKFVGFNTTKVDFQELEYESYYDIQIKVLCRKGHPYLEDGGIVYYIYQPCPPSTENLTLNDVTDTPENEKKWLGDVKVNGYSGSKKDREFGFYVNFSGCAKFHNKATKYIYELSGPQKHSDQPLRWKGTDVKLRTIIVTSSPGAYSGSTLYHFVDAYGLVGNSIYDLKITVNNDDPAIPSYSTVLKCPTGKDIYPSFPPIPDPRVCSSCNKDDWLGRGFKISSFSNYNVNTALSNYGIEIYFENLAPQCVIEYEGGPIQITLKDFNTGAIIETFSDVPFEHYYVITNKSIPSSTSKYNYLQVSNLSPDTNYKVTIKMGTTNSCTFDFNDVKSGNNNAPPAPTPTPTPTPKPPPSTPGTLPELYVSMYGATFFSGFKGKFNSGGLLVYNSPGLDSPQNDFQLQKGGISFREQAFCNWYWLRDGCQTFFNHYISFLTGNKSVCDNVRNAMISVGDFRLIVPNRVNTNGAQTYYDTGNGTITNPDNNNYFWKFGNDFSQYFAPNGPVDYGLPYSYDDDKTDVTFKDYTWEWEDGEKLVTNFSSLTGAIQKTIKSIGCPLILDFIIPLSQELKKLGKRTDSIDINIQFSLTPTGPSAGYILSWDVGNYAKSKASDGSNKLKPASGDDPWNNNKNGVDTFWGYHNQLSSNIGSNTNPIASANKDLYLAGNTFVNDGSSGNQNTTTHERIMDQGIGCGRSTWFEYSNTNYDTKNWPNIIDANSAGNTGFYKYQTNLNDIALNENSFPLDNAHQAFITIYYINQKIMELNYHIKNSNLKFTNDWGSDDFLPLITHIHSDSESASPYSVEGKYPKCDSKGNILVHPEKASGAKTNAEINASITIGDDVYLGTDLLKAGGVGYWKYLYNKYMPAECLPDWRLESSPLTLTKKMEPTTITNEKIPHSNDLLWDSNKPWNVNQGRNFHQEPSAVNGGYTLSNNNFKSRRKIDPTTGKPFETDGVQRYNIGSINYRTNAVQKYSEGIWEAWQELYNIGDVKAPSGTALSADGTEATPNTPEGDVKLNGIPNSFYNVIANNNQLSIDYTNTKPDGYGVTGSYDITKATKGSGSIIDIPRLKIGTDPLPRLGSGALPGGKNNPIANQVMGLEGIDEATPLVGYRLGLIHNGIYARVAKQFCGDMSNPKNFLGTTGINSVTNNACSSPNMTDIFLRFDNVGNIVPLDGRGFNGTFTKNYPSASTVRNGKKITDGFYLPIGEDVVSDDGTIDLSGVYSFTDTMYEPYNFDKWGNVNGTGAANTQGYGPQEAIATFSFEYIGGALTEDPHVAGPSSSVSDSKNESFKLRWNTEDGDSKGLFNDKNLAFTLRGRTLTTFCISEYLPAYGNPTIDYKKYDSKGKVVAENSKKGDTQFNLTNFWYQSGWDIYNQNTGIYSDGWKLIDTNTKSSKSAIQKNVAQGWAFSATGLGGEANLLSVLQNGNHFDPMKNFIQAAGYAMGGDKYYNKTKVGLYTIEYLPISWLNES